MLVLVFAAVVTIINFHDEPTSPESKALLALAPDELRPDQNIYVALLGFNAPPGTSTIAWGESVSSAFNAKLSGPENDVGSQPDAASVAGTLKFVGKIGFCKPLFSSCWEHWQEYKSQTENLLRDNLELYNRYVALHGLAGYYETTSPSFEAPFAYVPSDVRNLFVANFVARMHASSKIDRQAAMRDICADIQTWRIMLTAEGSILSKMIAIANLHGDFAVIGDMLADPALDVSDVAGPDFENTVLVNARDWQIGNAFRSEFRAINQFLSEMALSLETGKGKWIDPEEQHFWWRMHAARIESHFLKLQATENLYALKMGQLQVLGNAPPAEFKMRMTQWREWEATHAQTLGLQSLYNPLGRSMFDVGSGIDDEYPERAQDLAAFERAVRLAYEIRMNRIANSDIPAYIRHSELAMYPATGEEATWDATRSQLSVRPMAPSMFTPHRFTVPIWRAQQ